MQVRHWGLVDYATAYEAMRQFTTTRDESTPDELWLCEHPPVFTQGIAGQDRHVLLAQGTPVVRTDRGGQITYHGPGQIVAYPLIDLRRRSYFVKEYVYRLEEAVIRTLGHWGVTGHRIASAPGIYVRLQAPQEHASLHGPAPSQDPFLGLGKISALGIKVHRHCTYHGLALNVAMDLEPYSRINPCGYAGLISTDLSTIGVQTTVACVQAVLADALQALLAP